MGCTAGLLLGASILQFACSNARTDASGMPAFGQATPGRPPGPAATESALGQALLLFAHTASTRGSCSTSS